MTFKLNIEKVYGGYILTVERPDCVERRVVGICDPILSNHGILNIMDKAVGCTILDKISFTTENKHVVLNIECYGDVVQDDVESTSNKPEWREEDEKMFEKISDMLYEGYKTSESKMIWDEIRKWVKSHLHHPTWQPTEEQMKELHTMVCECRPADTQLLSDIYWGLKSQIDEL